MPVGPKEREKIAALPEKERVLVERYLAAYPNALGGAGAGVRAPASTSSWLESIQATTSTPEPFAPVAPAPTVAPALPAVGRDLSGEQVAAIKDLARGRGRLTAGTAGSPSGALTSEDVAHLRASAGRSVPGGGFAYGVETGPEAAAARERMASGLLPQAPTPGATEVSEAAAAQAAAKAQWVAAWEARENAPERVADRLQVAQKYMSEGASDDALIGELARRGYAVAKRPVQPAAKKSGGG